MPKVTIYTLAQELNMTPSMVSRAFNPDARISEDKRKIVLETAKKYDFSKELDKLDTWFSSALWPFSTLGWPEKTEDMERFYPNDVLVTAYDIIFFWVARMVFQAEHITGVRPFKDCLIHGLIRDKEGRKMSKSLGNGVDPMDLIDEYGADSLRYYLTTDVALGTDLRFDEVKISSTWNYINKIWNRKEAKDFYNRNSELGIVKSWEHFIITEDKRDRITYRSLLFIPYEEKTFALKLEILYP